jgi:YfiH family protein
VAGQGTATAAGVRDAAAAPHVDPYVEYDAFTDFGVRALATTRAAGSFGTLSDEPVGAVTQRWDALHAHVAAGGVERFATARQVHGADVITHVPGWRGWLRGPAADGHLALERGTACAVTVADCVPVYVAHPSGAVALLHSGWRGTTARILERAVRALAAHGRAAGDLRVLLGPAICGDCYEVSPDVYAQLTGRTVDRPTTVDLRGVIAAHARALGVPDVRTVDVCTRCDNAVHYSHRAGDPGRQLGVMFAAGT